MGETLPRAAVERAWELAADADAFIVLDSDLRTAPISLLPSVPLTRGVPLVLVGETPTQYDRYAARVVRAPSSGVITAVADLIAPSPRDRLGDLLALDGRAAIVTGASSGLGAIIARGLAGAGCAVLLAARRADRLDAVAAEVTAAGGGPSPTPPTCAIPPTPPSWSMHACMHLDGWTGWC